MGQGFSLFLNGSQELFYIFTGLEKKYKEYVTDAVCGPQSLKYI